MYLCYCQLPAVEDEGGRLVCTLRRCMLGRQQGIVEEWYNAATTKPAVTAAPPVFTTPQPPSLQEQAEQAAAIAWDAKAWAAAKAQEAATAKLIASKAAMAKREAEARAMGLRTAETPRLPEQQRRAMGAALLAAADAKAAGQAAAAATRLLEQHGCGCAGDRVDSPGREDAARSLGAGTTTAASNAVAAATAAAAAAAAASAAMAASAPFGAPTPPPFSEEEATRQQEAARLLAATREAGGRQAEAAQMLMMGGHAPAMVMNAVHMMGGQDPPAVLHKAFARRSDAARLGHMRRAAYDAARAHDAAVGGVDGVAATMGTTLPPPQPYGVGASAVHAAAQRPVFFGGDGGGGGGDGRGGGVGGDGGRGGAGVRFVDAVAAAAAAAVA